MTIQLQYFSLCCSSNRYDNRFNNRGYQNSRARGYDRNRGKFVNHLKKIKQIILVFISAGYNSGWNQQNSNYGYGSQNDDTQQWYSWWQVIWNRNSSLLAPEEFRKLLIARSVAKFYGFSYEKIWLLISIIWNVSLCVCSQMSKTYCSSRVATDRTHSRSPTCSSTGRSMQINTTMETISNQSLMVRDRPRNK